MHGASSRLVIKLAVGALSGVAELVSTPIKALDGFGPAPSADSHTSMLYEVGGGGGTHRRSRYSPSVQVINSRIYIFSYNGRVGFGIGHG